jgi:hypothetical protein
MDEERAHIIARAALISGASQIEEMAEAPGGGHIVTLVDPEGFPVNLIYGQSAAAPTSFHPENLLVNTESEKPRVRKFQRFEPGPAAVHKVGGHTPIHIYMQQTQLPTERFETPTLTDPRRR